MLEISDEKGSETHAFTILIYKVQNEPIVALVEGESASRITISASAVRSLGIRPPGDGEVRKFWVQWVRDAGKVVTLL